MSNIQGAFCHLLPIINSKYEKKSQIYIYKCKITGIIEIKEEMASRMGSRDDNGGSDNAMSVYSQEFQEHKR